MMKKSKKIILELMLPVILCWFLMSLFVDIFTIPTVFRNSRVIEDAGKIGMTVFGRFNLFELFFSTTLLAGALLSFPSRKIFYFALPLFTLSLLYFFYMTPMIASITQVMHTTAQADPHYLYLQGQHARFHQLYRSFEMAKLIVLLILFVTVLVDKVRAPQKNSPENSQEERP